MRTIESRLESFFSQWIFKENVGVLRRRDELISLEDKNLNRLYRVVCPLGISSETNGKLLLKNHTKITRVSGTANYLSVYKKRTSIRL